MRWTHTTAQLSHVWATSNESGLVTQVYRNDFERLWKRMDRFAGAGAPSRFDTLLIPEQNSQYYDILTGADDSSSALNGAGDLIQAYNQRTFTVKARKRAGTALDLGPTRHDLELGVRFHEDQIRRDHTEHRYQMVRSLIGAGTGVGQTAMNNHRHGH